MNDTLEKIVELPSAAKGIILLVGAGLVVAAYWFLFYIPVGEEIGKVNEQTAKLKLDIADKTRIAANLPKFEAEVERLDVEHKKALAELPDRKEIPQLLAKISDKVKESGLDIRLFKPKAEQKKDFYAEVPVEIEVAGTYHQVATFFDEIGHLERIVNLDQFGMTEPKREETGMVLKTSLTATSFRFLDESERPKEDPSASKKRRKKPSAKDGKDEG